MSSQVAENRAAYFLVANFLVLAVVADAWFLEARLPDFYYMSVQEPESGFTSFIHLGPIVGATRQRPRFAGI